ncbi:hypothetical protein LMH87_005677 [Akanthomyces muscarius]|uniref:Uncharacterized protein n=1 Tax=Akanthomyces muscarius TaxID=2231603 RepID=A0A9W8QPA0_AKAMU|nr:hypothetical protein LMH87_005677 [Akanthomyces muscarius]KAJ4163984.1 hypothetical protein LMH87_005677 [Akanthomyces muscarius]
MLLKYIMTSAQNSLTPEAIIGIVALFLAFPPLAFGFWRWRRSVRRLAPGVDSLYASDEAMTSPRNATHHLPQPYSPVSPDSGASLVDYTHNQGYRQHRLIMVSIYEEIATGRFHQDAWKAR